MKTKVLAVIPARYQSSRFPGRPLALIKGKPLIEYLYREVSKAKLVDRAVIATDSDKIAKAVEKFGGEVVITSPKHRTGSDRTAEVAEKLGGDLILNIQADHIGVRPHHYDKIIEHMLADRDISYATIAAKIGSEDILYNPNRVKVIFDNSENALWFSRYPIPFLQGVNGNRAGEFDFYYHIGVYFFRKAALVNFHHWPRSRMEKAESLEQLRILENRGNIKIFKIRSKTYAIDVPEDLEAINNFR